MAESNQNTDESVVSQPEEQVIANQGEKQVDNSSAAVAEKEEKVLKQSEVNKIVGGAKIEAYERGKRDSELLSRQQQVEQPQTQGDDKITLSKDEVRQLIQDESTALAHQQRANEVAQQFIGKMKSGMQQYDDFESVVGELDIPTLPAQLIDVANSMDNTADIMYELGKNPTKFASVLTLSVGNPVLAHKEMVRLSDSIKKNKAAVENSEKTKVNEPLSQEKPSLAGTDNGELKTVGDFRKQSWLRG